MSPSFSHDSYVQLLDHHKLISSSSCAYLYVIIIVVYDTSESVFSREIYVQLLITKGYFLFLVLILCFTILVYHSFESYQRLTIVMFSSAKVVRWLVEAP